MKTWSFYSLTTGQIHGTTLQGEDDALAVNTPAGHVPIEGRYDHLSYRFDLETQAIVDYVPPQPDTDHEWNATTRRWVKRADVLAREAQRTQAQARIEALERKQLRPMRELVIDPANVDAATRLAEIELQIVTLRQEIR